MKKLITILAILTVLVGALFASTDTHQIKLTVTIDNTEPSFVLKTKTGADAASAAAGATGTAALSAANKTALTTANGVATVTFDVVQTTYARSVSTYRMRVTAGNFVLTSNGTPVANPTTNEKFGVVAEHPSIGNGDNVANISYPTVEPADGYYRVKYNGVVDASTNNVKVGSFSVSYNANVDAKPGSYVSNVSLTVETP